jgi:hypothetical protein
VKRLFTISLYVVAGFTVLLLLVAGATQTQFFRNRLREAAASALDSLLVADVSLGELDGNLISGFSLGPITIRDNSDTVLAVERLDLRYDLFQIPGRTIAVKSVLLVRPRINLVCGRDGIWNLRRMIRSSPADTTAAGPFNWSIVLRSFELRDGRVSLTDSSAPAAEHEPKDGDHVDYHRFRLTHVNLRSSLLYTALEQRATITSLSFFSDQAGVSLDSASGDFRLTPRGAFVNGLSLLTRQSRLRLDAAVEGIDLRDGISLGRMRKAPVRLRLSLQGLDLREFGALLPPVDFLKGRLVLDLDAQGTMSDLAVKRLNFTVGESHFGITGNVLNLHQPEDLLLRVRVTGVNVTMEDARRLMPAMHLPEFPGLGPAALTVDFDGRPLNFRTRLQAETKGGAIASDVTLVIGGPESLTYRAHTALRSLNPSLLLNDPGWAGRLNGTVNIEGSGVRLKTLRGQIEATVDSSEMFGQVVAPSRLSLTAAAGDIAGSIDIRLGAMRSALSGRVQGLSARGGSFEVKGEVANLNLQDVLRRSEYNSDITMHLNASGRGMPWDRLSGDAVLDITDSRYGDYRVESGSAHLRLDQQDPAQKEIVLESNIADFTLKGAFDLPYLVSLLAYETGNVRLAVGKKFSTVDSTLAGSVDRSALVRQGEALRAAGKTIDATYLLRLKDLVPLSRVAGNRTFNGVGVLRGALLGDYTNLSLEGRLALSEFFYGNADSGILIQDAEATLQITDLKPTDPLRGIEVYILAEAGKMHLNRTRVDSLQVSFKYSQEYSSYTARARYDHDLFARVNGIADVDTAGVVFTLNGLDLAFRDFAWTGEGGASVEFGPRGVRVRDVVMRRDTQVVRFSGFLGTGGALGATVRAEGINLEGMRYLRSDALSGDAGSFAGIAALDLDAHGTLRRPEFNASVRIARFAFRGVPFGAITGGFQYADGALHTDLEAQYRARTGQERPALTVKGVVPVELGSGGEDSAVVRPPFNLHIRSDGVQMSILDPLVPTFNQLTGIVKCDVTVAGSTQNPDIAGELSIDSCSFLFEPNNIFYSFEGRFKPSGGRIEVVEAVVRNVASDRRLGRDGSMTITGDFALHELVPTDFKLKAVGTLLVVKETTRKSSLSVYGNLFVETDATGLRFTGSIDRSLLRGYVLVKNSSLVFPPTLNTGARETERTVPVVVVDDTSRAVAATDRAADSEYFGPVPDSTEIVHAATESGRVSFLDGLRYDLQIESRGGNTEIRMVFNPATGEELVANLEGKFSILDDGKQWVGTLTVGRAFYNFTKRFDAEGTLRYTGDFLNPELDITAKYAGTRTLRDSLSGSRRENIVVILTITGTRFEPRLEISMTIDGQDYQSYSGPKSSDVGSDAIQFLITGNFPLTDSQKNDIAADIRSTVGSSLVTGATSLLSSTLSEFLRRETGFINSIEIGYGAQGNLGESADIRVSGVVGDGLWRIGGKVLEDPFNNANISLQYSLGDIFRNSGLTNLMFELERRVETSIGQLNDRKETNSARLFYRLSF